MLGSDSFSITCRSPGSMSSAVRISACNSASAAANRTTYTNSEKWQHALQLSADAAKSAAKITPESMFR